MKHEKWVKCIKALYLGLMISLVVMWVTIPNAICEERIPSLGVGISAKENEFAPTLFLSGEWKAYMVHGPMMGITVIPKDPYNGSSVSFSSSGLITWVAFSVLGSLARPGA